MPSTDEGQEYCAIQSMSRDQQKRILLENMPPMGRIIHSVDTDMEEWKT